MPDINLLEDTKRPDEEHPHKKSSEPLAWTKPKVEKAEEPTKEPSSFTRAFRSFFTPPPSPPKGKPLHPPSPPSPAPQPRRLPPVQTPGPLSYRQARPPAQEPPPPPAPQPAAAPVEDIFAMQRPEPPAPPAPSSPPPPREETVTVLPPKPQLSRVLNEPRAQRAPLGRGTILQEDVRGKAKEEGVQLFRSRAKRAEREEEAEEFGVNLLPEDLVVKFEPRRRLMQLLMAVGAAAGFIAVTFLGLSLYESRIVRRTEDVQQDIAAVEREIGGLRDIQKEALAAKRDADAITDLLASHIHWTKFFAALEQYTIAEVYYNGDFSATSGGTITLSAVARSYTAVARQLRVFEEAAAEGTFIQSVESEGAQLEQGTGELPEGLVNFDVTLELARNFLSYPTGAAYESSPLRQAPPLVISPEELTTGQVQP